jgi:hypothetical protein
VGQSVQINSFMTVHPFETAHVIPSLGYVLSRTKRKLKQSLLGLPGPEIKRRKDAGEVKILSTTELQAVCAKGRAFALYFSDLWTLRGFDVGRR